MSATSQNAHMLTLGLCGQVAVMSPGMYELSDYSLSWASADPGRQADGLYNGRPFLLRVNV